MWTREELVMWRNHFKHGTLCWILCPIIRVLMFPVMLLWQLYKWAYGYE